MPYELRDLGKFDLNKFEIKDPIILISAEEMRQYVYCKRIPYFRRVMHVKGFKSYKMERGEKYHDKEIRNKYLEKPAPNLERYYNIYLKDDELGLLGLLDMFEFDGNEAYPVEFKTGHPSRSSLENHHLAQVIVQALLIESEFDFLVRKAKIVYIDYNYDVIFHEITVEMKRKILRNVEMIREMVFTEKLPDITIKAGKCQDCEYFPYCRKI